MKIDHVELIHLVYSYPEGKQFLCAGFRCLLFSEYRTKQRRKCQRQWAASAEDVWENILWFCLNACFWLPEGPANPVWS
jgi:hypothetical protein